MTTQDQIVLLEDNHRLRAENDTLRRERDEARRMYCDQSIVSGFHGSHGARCLAKNIGWDCFKEETQCANERSCNAYGVLSPTEKKNVKRDPIKGSLFFKYYIVLENP